VTDPRNVAHDKKVQQEKKHQHVEISPGAEHAVQPGRKPHMAPKPDAAVADDDAATEPEGPVSS
jgi:hypothetical protein